MAISNHIIIIVLIIVSVSVINMFHHAYVCVCVCGVYYIPHMASLPPCRPGNEVMYGFAHFTSSLNELEPGIAPTDCRFRPDQRIMEEGDFPRADKEKVWCSMHSIPTVVIKLLEVVSSAGYKSV